MEWYFVASLLTVLTSSQGILTTLSQSNGRYRYDFATVPFLAEIFKRVPEIASAKDDFRLEECFLVLLAVGTTTSQVKGCGEASCQSLLSAPIQGYMFGILSACLSALAGIYTEFLMKKNNDSLYWQNVQLYAFGAIFNMARLILDDFRGGFENGQWWQRLFNGYTLTTWLVVLNLGSTGLLVSWLIKYADNIVKVYSTSMAMLLTMILSVFLFDFRPTLQLFLGIIVCAMSLHMYFAAPNMLFDLPPTIKQDPESLNDVPADRKAEA